MNVESATLKGVVEKRCVKTDQKHAIFLLYLSVPKYIEIYPSTCTPKESKGGTRLIKH